MLAEQSAETVVSQNSIASRHTLAKTSVCVQKFLNLNKIIDVIQLFEYSEVSIAMFCTSIEFIVVLHANLST